jgi:hypothetical protein
MRRLLLRIFDLLLPKQLAVEPAEALQRAELALGGSVGNENSFADDNRGTIAGAVE